MHALLLFVHSLFRWVVLLAGFYAVGSAFGRRDARPGRWFAISLDIQMLIGLILYWLSPITTGAHQQHGCGHAEPGRTVLGGGARDVDDPRARAGAHRRRARRERAREARPCCSCSRSWQS